MPILSAMRLGHDIGVSTKIHWPILIEGTHNTGEYDTLFSAEFIAGHFVSDADYKALNGRAMAIETALGMEPDALKQAIDGGDIYAFSQTVTKTRLKCEDEATVNRHYGQAIKLIGFSTLVQSYMDKIDQAFAGKNTTAYHIRHGDLTRHYRTRGKPWTAKYIPNEIYLAHMEAHQDDANRASIIFGDCPQSLDWIAARHGALMRIDDLVNLSDVNSLQRDFLELYAMSRTEKIVAPKMSGFSQMAAGIGETPVKDIMQDLSDTRIDKAFQALADRLQNDRESFTNDGDAAQSLAHLVPYLCEFGESRKAAALLKAEIDRGNSVPFLYRLWADIAYDAKDSGLLTDLSAKSRDAMILERGVTAEIDAMSGSLELANGNPAAAIPVLRRAAMLSPFGAETRNAITALCTDRKNDLTHFYPVDRDVLLARFMTKGRTPDKLDALDMRMFVWDLRYFLLGTMERTLTINGIARRSLASVEKSRQHYAGKDDRTEVSLRSFATLIEAEIGNRDAALKTSGALADENAGDPFILQRHILNLRMKRDAKTGAQYAEKLLEIAPNIPCYHGLYGDILFELRQFDQALHHYEIANPGAVNYPVFVLRHANLLRRLKRMDEAEKLSLACLDQTSWLDPYFVEHVRSTLAHRTPGELLPRLQKLVDEGGTLRRVHNVLAQLLSKMGEKDQALTYAHIAATTTPNNVDFRLLEIRLLAELGREAEARALLKNTDTLPRHAKTVSLIEHALA